MHYMPSVKPELLRWLRAELGTAGALTAFATAADENGAGLLRDPVHRLLTRGGTVRIVVPTQRESSAVLRGLDLENGEGLTVDVAGCALPINAYVLVTPDGTLRAYHGATSLTYEELTEAAPGVLFDMRKDATAAQELLNDMTNFANEAMADADNSQLLADLMQPAMDLIEGRAARRDPGERDAAQPPLLTGIPTGFGDLDQLTGGMIAGDLWVVTGRSGAGKSVLGLDLARSAALRHMNQTGLVQARDGAEDVILRLLSAEARVGLLGLRLGRLNDDDWARLARRMGEVAEAPLHVTTTEPDDQTQPTAATQLAAAGRVAAQHELRLLIVDDLPESTTQTELKGLKQLAISAGACVVALLADGPKQSMADVERDACRTANLVLRVDREHDMTPGGASARAGEADFIVLRHRRGPIALITVAFQGHYSRFMDMRPS